MQKGNFIIPLASTEQVLALLLPTPTRVVYRLLIFQNGFKLGARIMLEVMEE